MAVALSLTAAGALAPVTTLWSADSASISAADDPAVIARQQQLQADPASPVIGDPRGDVTIVEFFDYACPFCKAAQPRLQAALRADAHVRLILKEFPILTPESLIAARASLAAMRQHKYQQFHEALMAYHGTWGEQVIYSTAKSVGLDMTRLRHDMAAREIDNEIIANFNLARGLRAFDTPTFIVGNHIVKIPSAQIDFPTLFAAERAQR
jgi:protein-disulfide isomerase